MTRVAINILVMAWISFGCGQPSPATSDLIGVWRVSRVDFNTSGSIRANPSPHPGQAIFTRSHYSLTWIPGETNMREFQNRWIPTDAEKIQRYGEIVVNSGSYTVDQDSLVTLRPVVSRVPEFMGGGKLIYGYRIRGDTLLLTSLDEYSRDGVQAPWAASGTRVTISLVRVE